MGSVADATVRFAVHVAQFPCLAILGNTLETYISAKAFASNGPRDADSQDE